jgi:ABC-type uncharacterized transport system involved in gliding motility auxiliary subunit
MVIASANGPLLAPEISALEGYLNRGGRLAVMLEPNYETGLDKILRPWKIEVNKDLIVDVNPLNRLLGLGPATPLVQPLEGEHPLTKGMTAAGVMPTARSLAVSTGGDTDIEVTPLLATGETAWGETNWAGGSASRDARDFAGPLDVAIAATKNTSSATDKISDQGRLVAFGDSDWISNKYFDIQGNTDLFLNTVNWLAEQEERITIHTKARAASQLFLTGAQLGQLKFFSMDILPVLLVALGLGIVLIRRQQ